MPGFFYACAAHGQNYGHDLIPRFGGVKKRPNDKIQRAGGFRSAGSDVRLRVEREFMKYTHVSCSRCGTRVSNLVAANEDLVIRAFIECGACIEKQPDYKTRIKEYEQESVFLRERVISLEAQLSQHCQHCDRSTEKESCNQCEIEGY